ncbi:MAG: ATP-binding protein [Chloroflexi bacterium]|nr:ATP-binding protein [Chloroflexota bacterium]
MDILEVERHLLKDEQSNLLLMRGMGGAGKTTLLHHLAWWWQKTRLVQRVFYFGYDVKAYHTQEIVATLALALFGKVDVPWLAVRQKLRAERHLLILDNMESITGERLAVQNTLPPAEQTALRAFLADLVGGKTLILLGSRSDEQWLVGRWPAQPSAVSRQQSAEQSAAQHSALSPQHSSPSPLSPPPPTSPPTTSPASTRKPKVNWPRRFCSGWARAITAVARRTGNRSGSC